MMFGKILKKLLGKPVGTIADTIIDEKLDRATGGLSSKAEELVKKRKKPKLP